MESENPLYVIFSSSILLDSTVADGYMKHYVPIPDDIADEYAAAGVTHLEGSLDDHKFRRIIHERPDGAYCLKFGMTWLKQAGLQVDQQVVVQLAPDPDPDRVEVPYEIAAALASDARLEQAWETLAPSRRKMLGYEIERAKRPETRQRRADAILDELRQRIDNNKS